MAETRIEKTGAFGLARVSQVTGNPILDVGYQCSDMRPYFIFKSGNKTIYSTVHPTHCPNETEVSIYSPDTREIDGVSYSWRKYIGGANQTIGTIIYNGEIYNCTSNSSYQGGYEYVDLYEANINKWAKYKPFYPNATKNIQGGDSNYLDLAKKQNFGLTINKLGPVTAITGLLNPTFTYTQATAEDWKVLNTFAGYCDVKDTQISSDYPSNIELGNCYYSGPFDLYLSVSNTLIGNKDSFNISMNVSGDTGHYILYPEDFTGNNGDTESAANLLVYHLGVAVIPKVDDIQSYKQYIRVYVDSNTINYYINNNSEISITNIVFPYSTMSIGNNPPYFYVIPFLTYGFEGNDTSVDNYNQWSTITYLKNIISLIQYPSNGKKEPLSVKALKENQIFTIKWGDLQVKSDGIYSPITITNNTGSEIAVKELFLYFMSQTGVDSMYYDESITKMQYYITKDWYTDEEHPIYTEGIKVDNQLTAEYLNILSFSSALGITYSSNNWIIPSGSHTATIKISDKTIDPFGIAYSTNNNYLSFYMFGHFRANNLGENYQYYEFPY